MMVSQAPVLPAPGFLAIMEEVEAGRVEAIVIKDMSRLGRDYLKVGQVMEVLRQRGVIAAARCMSTAPTMASGFLNIPVPIIPKFRVGHYALHNTVSMRVLF